MGVGVAGLQLEWAEGHGIRLETLVEGELLAYHAVTADGVDRAELAAEGVDDRGVVVPGAHQQRLLAVEVAVRVRRAEVSESEDALVDHGKGVSHGLFVGLADLHLDIFLGVGGLRNIDIRLQLQLLVFHLDWNHAIQTYRHAVAAVVRLNQRHVDVHIRYHVGGGGELHLAFLAEVVEREGL